MKKLLIKKVPSAEVDKKSLKNYSLNKLTMKH